LMEKDDKFVFHFPEISSYIVDQLPNKSIVLFGLTKRSGNGKILFNSMCGLDKKGIFYSYDKRFLAPFGEFRPYGLQTIMDWLRVYALDDFQRGKRYQPLMKINNNFWVQPAICYEGSYTQKIISAEELRPDLLVVMTNDSWFHANGKEQQCLSHVLRAVEEGLPMVRSANSGFSGYVSPLGDYDQSTSIKSQIREVHYALPPTPYRIFSSLGDWSLDFAFFILGLICFFL
jgi:apolipoprotein N-acyltransferase